jgi:hypothetical protein
MWQYNNVTFIYSNPVDSVYGQRYVVNHITTYIKSKYALMQALMIHVESSYLGPYTEIDTRTVKHDPPFKV